MRGLWVKALVGALLALAVPAAAQNMPEFEWASIFGGAGDEHASALVETDDGGFVVAVTTYETGSVRILLVAFDADGNETWSRLLEEPGTAAAMARTADGGYIIAGTTPVLLEGEGDVLLVKVDGEGTQEWARKFGGDSGDEGCAVVQIADGGYAVAGFTGSFGAGDNDFYVVKTDAAGEEVWSRTFGGDRQDRCYSLVATGDGELVLAGETLSFGAGGVDGYLVKVDAEGRELWSHTYGDSLDDFFQCVRATREGGFILAGDTWSRWEPERLRIYLVKTDPEGHEQWSRGYRSFEYNSAKSVSERDEGGFIIAGSASLLRTDGRGRELWEATWEDLCGPGLTEGWYIASSMVVTADGGYAVAGYVDADSDDVFDGFVIRFGSEVGPEFMRGDTNADGEVDIADAVWTILWLFASKWDLPCHDAVDANDDGELNIADVIRVLSHLFLSTGALPEPFGSCGMDMTDDVLGCRSYRPCASR